MMTTLETLRRLCEADGVSGDEGARFQSSGGACLRLTPAM